MPLKQHDSADDAADPSAAPTAPRWNPPPHLEARLSKRRRRSGLHSPSTPMQHASLATTRRQTLLEARKIQLAARAAHVENVRRMRASSHAGVADRLRTLQQSLNAADKSRNAILAKVAGSCANEVARAKRLAMETRLRREEETRALRESVEDRLAEAQRRREEALRERGIRRRRERSSSSESITRNDGAGYDIEDVKEARRVSLQLNTEQAARRIQRAWRRSRDLGLVKAFVDLGLTIESVRDADFMEISRRFQDAAVIKATVNLMKRCGLLDGLDGQDAAKAKAKYCRTFLSAYLILGHPAEVLSNSNDGENESALITQSKDLLIAFESFLSSPSFPAPESLKSSWLAFSAAFDAWKARDSEILINTMVAQYAELDLIWQKVKDDTVEHVAQDFKEGIKENQLMLLVRIRRLVGERTRDLIRAAVKETRRTRLPKKEKRDTKPRADGGAAADGSGVSTSETAPETPLTPPRTRDTTPGSADTVAPSELSEVLADGMPSNRQIVHELALDRNFRLEPRKRSGLEQMVQEQARRAFWDVMREDIDRGNLEKWIPGLAKTVKDKLLRLLDPNGSVHRSVDDSIDTDLIAQQCRHGSYDPTSLLRYVLDLLPKLCSPARDEDVQALLALSQQPSVSFVDIIQQLLDVLEAMQLDHANFLLMLSAPTVLPEAIPYERRLFAADLSAGRTSLTRTTSWLLSARAQLDPAATASQVHARALLELVFSLDDEVPELPETFHLDAARVVDTRAAIRTLILGAAIVLTTKTILRRDPRGSYKELKSRVASLLSSSASSATDPSEIGEQVKSFVAASIACPPALQSSIAAATERILRRRGADPIVRVVFSRLRTFLEERIRVGEGESRERVRLASEAGEKLGAWGVVEWISEANALVEKLGTWKRVMEGSYGPWYDQILGMATGAAAA